MPAPSTRWRPARPRAPHHHARHTPQRARQLPAPTVTLPELLRALVLAEHSTNTFTQHVVGRLATLGSVDVLAEHSDHLTRVDERTYRFVYRQDVLDQAYATVTGDFVYAPDLDPWRVMQVRWVRGSLHSPGSGKVHLTQLGFRGYGRAAWFGSAQAAHEAMHHLV